MLKAFLLAASMAFFAAVTSASASAIAPLNQAMSKADITKGLLSVAQHTAGRHLGISDVYKTDDKEGAKVWAALTAAMSEDVRNAFNRAPHMFFMVMIDDGDGTVRMDILCADEDDQYQVAVFMTVDEVKTLKTNTLDLKEPKPEDTKGKDEWQKHSDDAWGGIYHNDEFGTRGV